MHRLAAPLHPFVVALIGLSLLTGCVSSRYRQVQKPSPPTPLDLRISTPGITAIVNGVIVIHSPGSWKRDAYWDEYLVTFANDGPASVTIRSASLLGLSGQMASSGGDPWQLEKQSRSLADRNYGLAKNTAVHLGGGVGAVAVGAGFGAALGAAAGTGGGYISASATGLGAAAGGILAIPIFAGASVYRNVHNRHEVEHVFHRRQVALPVLIAPGQSIQGSLFFPITPGPQKLILQLDPSTSADLIIDLHALVALHLQPVPKI